jgi:hypothetical protein
MNADEVQRMIAESLTRIGGDLLGTWSHQPFMAEAARLAPKVEPEPVWPQRRTMDENWNTSAEGSAVGMPVEVYPAGVVGRLVEALEHIGKTSDWPAAPSALRDFRAALRGGK